MTALLYDTQLNLLCMVTCTCPTMPGFSDMSPTATAFLEIKPTSNIIGVSLTSSVCGPMQYSPMKSSWVTWEASKLGHQVPFLYLVNDYPIFVVQLLKTKLELQFAETIIHDE